MKVFLILLAIGLACGSPLQAQRDERAEQLVDGWIAAAGGPRLWDRVRDLRYTITTVWYDSTGQELRRRPRQVWIKKTDDAFLVRVERNEVDGRYVQIWNRGARASLNAQPLADTARAVREVEYVAGDLTYWMGLPWKLRDPGVHLAYAQQGDAQVVHVTFGDNVGLHDGDRFWYYWRDPASPFPSEVHYIEEGQSDADRKQVLLRDLQKLGPGLYLARRIIQNAHGVTMRALLVSDVFVNRGISDSVFR
jgi:hypothetical protein